MASSSSRGESEAPMAFSYWRKPERRRSTMTTNEYLATPESVAPAELAYGVLRVAESPVVRHQRVVRDLTIVLTAFTKERGLGEVLPAPMDVVLDRERHLVVQPDVLFVAAGRDEIVTDRIEGAPDLVIEVLSPRPRIRLLARRSGPPSDRGSGEPGTHPERSLPGSFVASGDGVRLVVTCPGAGLPPEGDRR